MRDPFHALRRQMQSPNAETASDRANDHRSPSTVHTYVYNSPIQFQTQPRHPNTDTTPTALQQNVKRLQIHAHGHYTDRSTRQQTATTRRKCPHNPTKVHPCRHAGMHAEAAAEASTENSAPSSCSRRPTTAPSSNLCIHSTDTRVRTRRGSAAVAHGAQQQRQTHRNQGA